jgi:hypothetical protein
MQVIIWVCPGRKVPPSDLPPIVAADICDLPSAYVSIRQHTSSYVIIPLVPELNNVVLGSKEEESAYVSIRQRQHTSAYVSIPLVPVLNSVVLGSRDEESAYVSIRQHTSASAYVSIPLVPELNSVVLGSREEELSVK